MQSLLLLLPALAAFLPAALADCDSFEPIVRTHNDVTFRSLGTPSTFRISAIIDCTEDQAGNVQPSGNCNSTQCPLDAEPNFYLRLNRTMNYTTTMDAKNSLFDLARPSFQQQDSINFNESWAYSPTGVRSCLNEGQAGYWGFSPFFYCVDGTLSGCSGDDYPSDGAVVRFCAPKTLGGANPSAADGALNVVQCGGCEPEMAPANATLTEEESEALTEGEGESTDGSTSLGVAVSKSISAIALAVIVGLGLCL